MKIKKIIILFIICSIVIVSCIFLYNQNKISILSVENTKLHLEKIVNFKNLNIKKIKQINIDVCGQDADTINYDLNIEKTKELNKDNDTLKIPVKYLIAGKTSDVTITITKINNKIIQKKLKIKADISKSTKKYFPNIEIIKTREIKNRLYCFVFWFALKDDLVKFAELKAEFHPMLLDSKGNIRSLDEKVMNILSGINNIPKNLLNFQFDIEREPIYLKEKNHLILFASDKTRKTITDHIIEINLTDNTIVKDIDLTKILDVKRLVQLDTRYKIDVNDWIHLNSMVYDKKDNSIIVSSRHQGVFKIGEDGKLKWILSPHKYWDKKYRKYLLKAVNSKNELLNKNIQDGIENYEEQGEEFEWCWAQHSVKLTNDNNILVFDNGYMRNFDKTKSNDYSRAVMYEVDEKNMTVKQIWQYGKELGSAFSSIAVCTVHHYDTTIFVNSTFIPYENRNSAKVKEVDIETKEVLSDFYFTFKNVAEGLYHPWFDEVQDARIVNVADLEDYK